MAGQPPPLQGSEDDFLDQFFSMAAGGSYSAAAAGGGRVAGDQPFSLALSLDAAAEASGSGKRLGGDAEGGKAVSVPQPRTHLSLPLSPFSLSPLHQTNLCACYVLQKKTVPLIYRTGTLCSCPGSSRRCLAPGCRRHTFAPTRLPRYSARCSRDVQIMSVSVTKVQVYC
jgi:hypothetical protein